jgi:hypothetical protein
LDNERVIIYPLSTHRIIQVLAKGIVAKDADDERRFGPGESFRWPLYELGKVKEENSFNLIFVGGSLRHGFSACQQAKAN